MITQLQVDKIPIVCVFFNLSLCNQLIMNWNMTMKTNYMINITGELTTVNPQPSFESEKFKKDEWLKLQINGYSFDRQDQTEMVLITLEAPLKHKAHFDKFKNKIVTLPVNVLVSKGAPLYRIPQSIDPSDYLTLGGQAPAKAS